MMAPATSTNETEEHAMPSETTTSTFSVSGMTCGHCVAAVTEEVSKIENVRDVDIDLTSGAVTLQSDGPVDPVAFAAAVEEAGYQLAN
jgi:copper chaperone CopZ